VAISFPTSLDNFTNPSSGNTLDSPSHSLQHSDINDAVEAMQRKVGVGTAVAGSASAGQVLTISAAGTSTWSTPTTPGLVQIVPSSISVGSGSGSVDANGAVTFSAASSVSLNGAFTSTYDNYRIVISSKASADTDFNFRIRTGTTDLSGGTDYFYGSYYIGSTSSQAAASINRTNASNNFIGAIGSWNGTTCMDIVAPFIAEVTTWTVFSSMRFLLLTAGSLNNNSTSYNGFTVFPSTGNITGTIRVYGYRN
jgi:hypothetical protein